MQYFDDILAARGYEVGEKIGKGSSADVYLVKKPPYKEQFVCKIMETTEGFRETALAKMFENEVNIMLKISHTNTIRVFDYFKHGCSYFIIMEHCIGGTLADAIQANPVKVRKNSPLYAFQIISALECCHCAGVAHLDIKPQNILMDQYDRPKLTDFGLSAYCVDRDKPFSKRGSFAYMSPEMIKGNCFDAFRSDIWSLGMTIYSMVTARSPNIRYQNFDDYWDSIKKDCNSYGEMGEIIQSCLAVNPQERPSLHELKERLYPLVRNVKRTQTYYQATSKKLRKPPIASSLNPRVFSRRCTFCVPRVNFSKPSI